jgi:hypothetical protein
MMIIKAIREHEAGLARTIVEGIDPLLLAQWRAVSYLGTRGSGLRRRDEPGDQQASLSGA